MSRKRRSFFVELFDVSPWFSVVLAVGAWLLGELVAAHGESLAKVAANQIVVQVLTQLLPAATLVLRFLALAFCFTAIVSFFRRRHRAKLLKTRTDLQSIRDLSWQDFERYVGEAYRHKGYTVEETGPGADGGIDLIARKNGETVLVQCKHRRTKKKVSVTVARELLGLVNAHSAANGALVTSGAFTRQALEFAEQNQLDLIDGEELIRLIEESGGTPGSSNEHAAGSETPLCPQCQSPMERKTATRGPHAGNEFWGCTKFPRCKGIRDGAVAR